MQVANSVATFPLGVALDAVRVRRKRVRTPRSRHPGVVLVWRELSSGARSVRARYVDPDTGRKVWSTLDPIALRTEEARTAWAIALSQRLARRRMELEAGAPKLRAEPLSEALGAFLTSCKPRLRGATLASYSTALDGFLAWARSRGIATTADLTGARLVDFRETLAAEPRQRAQPGGSRGARQRVSGYRSPVSINTHLRPVKTALRYLTRKELLPQLTRDAIGDALRMFPVPRDEPRFIAPHHLRGLVEAALRHDAARFDATRAEHAGLKAPGSTPRYEPIAPFVAFLLLTGCRVGEACALDWASVDLDALDEHRNHVGEIKLTSAATKTHRGRTIDLSVSPALRTILARMRLRAGRERYVFGGREPLARTQIEAARKRMVGSFGAPSFAWQDLRRTTSTYLVNAQGIWGGTAIYREARQLGHSTAVAEKHYFGLLRGIPRDANTLEAAMQIADVVAAVGSRKGATQTARGVVHAVG